MKTFLFILLLLLPTTKLAAQNDALPIPATITINSAGEVFVPADLVVIQINITVTGTSPQSVFESHKSREEALTNLILERDIDMDDLRFQPMNISSHNNRINVSGEVSREYQSNQHVSLTLDDFELFEELQVFLIQNDFDTFSGRFSSTKIEEAETESLELALENARQKADLIARSFDKNVVRMSSVEHGAAPRARELGAESAMMFADTRSLIEFDQQVRVQSSVTVEFIIE